MSTNETTNVMKSLKDRAKEFSVRLPFMEGKDKGEQKELHGTVVTMTDYGFLNDDKGVAYVVFIVKEKPGKFYFGGEVLTDRMAQLEAEGYHSAVNEEGLPILMTEKKSKNGRGYTNVEFYPE